MNITPLTAIACGIPGRNSLLANSSPKGATHNAGKECWRAEGAESWPKSPGQSISQGIFPGIAQEDGGKGDRFWPAAAGEPAKLGRGDQNIPSTLDLC